MLEDVLIENRIILMSEDLLTFKNSKGFFIRAQEFGNKTLLLLPIIYEI